MTPCGRMAFCETLLSMRVASDGRELANVKLSSSDEYVEPFISTSIFTESVSIIPASSRLDELEHIPEPIAPTLFVVVYPGTDGCPSSFLSTNLAPTMGGRLFEVRGIADWLLWSVEGREV